MEQTSLSGKLAVILHADIAESTALVQLDERLAHERIQITFRRFSETIEKYQGRVRELRGDALLAEFDRASDAVAAALAFQVDHARYTDQLKDDIRPVLRVGIALGEVIIADKTITGSGVVLAQRVEQLAESGGVCITGAIHEALPQRMPFDLDNLGEQQVKGFDETVRVFRVALQPGATAPPSKQNQAMGFRGRKLKQIAALTTILVIIFAVGYWVKPWSPEQDATSDQQTTLALPDKPSIAVLPFTNMSGDLSQDYFSDGLTQDLITKLSLYRELFVIARNSTFVYKGKAVDVKQVGRELGVAFVVEGSVRRENNRVRISAQLIDAQSGNHVWAEQFDREFNDVFAIQDELTRSIAGRLAPEIAKVGVEQSRNKPTEDLDAWDLYLQASAALAEFNRESLEEAISLAETAITRDSKFAAPHIVIARAKGWQYFFRWTENPELTLVEAIESAKTAINLDSSDATGYAALGYLHRFSRNEIVAVSNLKRAVELNPNDANIRLEYAHMLDWFRLQDRALPQILEAIRLSPRDPRLQMMFFFKAHILFHLNEFEASLKASREMSSALTSDAWRVNYHLVRAANLAEIGRKDEAQIEITKSREINPKLSLTFIKKLFGIANNHPDNRKAWLGSLRKAGMPEE
jgi:TolB-like protein/class 3 adenylate cyclase/Flp pilus assembly protein TadD